MVRPEARARAPGHEIPKLTEWAKSAAVELRCCVGPMCCSKAVWSSGVPDFDAQYCLQSSAFTELYFVPVGFVRGLAHPNATTFDTGLWRVQVERANCTPSQSAAKNYYESYFASRNTICSSHAINQRTGPLLHAPQRTKISTWVLIPLGLATSSCRY